jgi:hypothetical protein
MELEDSERGGRKHLLPPMGRLVKVKRMVNGGVKRGWGRGGGFKKGRCKTVMGA